MSIHEHIDHQVRQGLLKRLDTLLVSMATRRTLFVTQNLAAQLSRQSSQRIWIGSYPVIGLRLQIAATAGA